MSKHTRKFNYLRVLQGDYGYGDGWEDLTAATDTPEGRREMRADLRAYRENAPEGRYRVISRRESRTDG